ncbi:Inosine-uridine preferring nucleoside hydrolase [Selenomonas ruminantium]|uniref:Inosine-uridine preferring nucleoside hydrolase n=1 Tax=Selenomonas ruminantium TaxID=971 RepID=A0A1M6VXL5_SELRU|nr:hypothetical protein [Selenomonas ruminantium]SHK86177.1 Inosine-uridine preferring nucleoside hydrolase [Selenomonas ruminantium]
MKPVRNVYVCLQACFFVVCLLVMGASYGDARSLYRQPVILDTDIGNSTDDLYAMDLLYKMARRGEVDIKGIVVDRQGDGFADLADIMNTYYGFPDIPIGVERQGVVNSTIHIDYRMLDDLKNADGSKMFARTDTNLQDNLDGYKLYRKLLAESKDHSVKIIGIGFVSSLVQLLESGPDEYSDLPGRELVRRKVDSFYFMATKLGKNADPGYNLRFDIPLSRRFLTEWPWEVKVYLSPSPVGGAIEYPVEMVMQDLANEEKHPILQVYRNKDCNTGQKMWDFLCVVNAVKPEVFAYSPTGFVSLDEAGQICFTKDKQGNYVYQLAGNKKWNDKMLAFLRFYGK